MDSMLLDLTLEGTHLDICYSLENLLNSVFKEFFIKAIYRKPYPCNKVRFTDLSPPDFLNSSFLLCTLNRLFKKSFALFYFSLL